LASAESPPALHPQPLGGVAQAQAPAAKNESKSGGGYSKTAYRLDAIIKIDETLCINCDACIRCCPGGLIAKDTKDAFPVPTADSWNFCIDCGHCVSICPTEALQQRSMGPEDCGSIDIHLVPTFDEARQFLVTRRSIRGYVNKPIEKDKILQLLDLARFAVRIHMIDATPRLAMLRGGRCTWDIAHGFTKPKPTRC
jgi:ferredoxin